MPRVLVLLVARIGALVDAHEARVVRIAAGDRMVLELAEAAREGDMLGARHVLVVQEQDAMLEQQCADLREQPVIACGSAEVYVFEQRTDRASEGLDPDRAAPARADDGRRGSSGGAH